MKSGSALEKGVNLSKKVVWIFNFMGVGTIIALIIFVYNGFFRQPQIECVIKENEKFFSAPNEFRSILINLHPQMVIRFDDEIILLVYLEEYYEEEKLIFDENREAKAVMCHAEYVKEVQKYMKKKIISSVCLKDSEISATEINERLHIYVSTLGGVRYESKEGNEEKRYCIIEQDGIVIDLDEHDDEVLNRLYETNMVMKEDLAGMEADHGIDRIIEGVTEKIISSIDK